MKDTLTARPVTGPREELSGFRPAPRLVRGNGSPRGPDPGDELTRPTRRTLCRAEQPTTVRPSPSLSVVVYYPPIPGFGTPQFPICRRVGPAKQSTLNYLKFDLAASPASTRADHVSADPAPSTPTSPKTRGAPAISGCRSPRPGLRPVIQANPSSDSGNTRR